MLRRVAMVIVAMGLCGLLVSGCDGAASEVKIGEDDSGDEVTLGVGQVLVVELPGNPSTGFTWSAAEKPDFLTLMGEPEFIGESDLVGAGGTIVLRFSADKAGSGTLELWYARPWESVQPEDVFTVDVTCR